MNTSLETGDLLAINDGQAESFFRVAGSEGANVVLNGTIPGKPSDARNQVKVPACILAAGIRAGGIGVFRSIV